MRYFILYPLSFFLLFSCTNWQARYHQSQLALERCINKEFDREVNDGRNIVVDFPDSDVFIPPSPPPPPDTVTVPDMVRKVITRYITQKIAFNRNQALHFSKDSVGLWITVENSVENATLLQRVRIDSLIYPAKTRHHYRTVIEYERNWLDIGIAFGLGFLITVLLVLALTIKRG